MNKYIYIHSSCVYVSVYICIIYICVCVLSRSVISNSLQLHRLKPARLCCPWGFSRQDYWSGLLCPPPGDLPNSAIEPRSSALQADSLLSEPQGICNKCVQSPTSAVNIYFNSLLESKIPVLAAIF